MNVFLYSSLIVLLIYVFWEDHKHLYLPLWVFPVLSLNWTGLALITTQWQEWFFNGLINTCCVLCSIGLLSAYAHWRYGVFINHVFGLGDFYYLLAFAWGYSPAVFLSIWIIGSLNAFVIAKLLQQQLVPYAGYLALTNVFAIVFTPLFASLSLYPQH